MMAKRHVGLIVLLIPWFVACVCSGEEKPEGIILPLTTEGVAPQKESQMPLVVCVDKTGDIERFGEIIEYRDLLARLWLFAHRRRRHEIIIRGDARASFAAIEKILMACTHEEIALWKAEIQLATRVSDQEEGRLDISLFDARDRVLLNGEVQQQGGGLHLKVELTRTDGMTNIYVDRRLVERIGCSDPAGGHPLNALRSTVGKLIETGDFRRAMIKVVCPEIPYGHVVEVVDALEAAGLRGEGDVLFMISPRERRDHGGG